MRLYLQSKKKKRNPLCNKAKVVCSRSTQKFAVDNQSEGKAGWADREPPRPLEVQNTIQDLFKLCSLTEAQLGGFWLHHCPLSCRTSPSVFFQSRFQLFPPQSPISFATLLRHSKEQENYVLSLNFSPYKSVFSCTCYWEKLD